jgi:hypothetical protein
MKKKVRPDYHPTSFSEFFTDWLHLLQGHVFPKYVVHSNPRHVNEWKTLHAFAEAHESVWPKLPTDSIRELVKQRYIRTHILAFKPDEADTEYVKERVKQATDYLRIVLSVDCAEILGMTEPNSYETGQRPDLTANCFSQRQLRFTATVTLLYQIRCNLFHGVKGYRNGSKRDALLTNFGVQILRDVTHTLKHDA